MNWLQGKLRPHLPKRIYLLVVAHLVLFAASYQLSMWLRYDMEVPEAVLRLATWLVALHHLP